MSVDYDLVVIGTNAHAYELVSIANQFQARVAWVCDRQNSSTNIDKIHHVLQILKTQLSDRTKPERLQLFAKEIVSVLSELSKYCDDELFEIAEATGVDLIFGKYKFQRQFLSKSQTFYTLEVCDPSLSEVSREFSKRQLTSRIYAIAHDVTIPLPKVFGLADHNYLTADQLLHLSQLPKSIAILGDDAQVCAIAQAINFFGVKTLLITGHSHILPNVDVTIARTLQASLETEGIEVYTKTQVTAVKEIENNRSRIWLNHQVIECDRLLIPLAPNKFHIPLDQHHQHIYQCNDYQGFNLIIPKIWSALNPAFNLALKNININTDASIVLTTPPLAQIGLTEVLAKQQFRKKLYILENSLEGNREDVGLYKIICDVHGQILGASMIGDRAIAVIEAIAIAMQGRVKIQNIAGLQDLQIAKQWQHLQNKSQKYC